jgi:hypothetical protein
MATLACSSSWLLVLAEQAHADAVPRTTKDPVLATASLLYVWGLWAAAELEEIEGRD